MSNQWGNGKDVFTATETTQPNRPHQSSVKVEFGHPETQFGVVLQGIWKVIAILGSALVLLFIVTALLGAVLGIFAGIAGAM